MKSTIMMFFALVCFTLSCSNKKEKGYIVKLKTDNLKNNKVIIYYPLKDSMVVDSTYTYEKGWAIFRGEVSEPVIASIAAKSTPDNSIEIKGGLIPGPVGEFVLTNDEITIEGDINNLHLATIKGGKANQEWGSIKKEQSQLINENWLEMKRVYTSYDPDKDTVEFDKLTNFIERNNEKEKDLNTNFILKNPNSIVSVYLLYKIQNAIDFNLLEKLYNGLNNDLKTISYAKELESYIKKNKSTAIGMQAFPINKNDINGKPFNLQSLKGKYVLLDFWGSWCMPCRKSHPHMKELYKKYKTEGFEIVGIAQEESPTYEKSRKSWLEAVKKDDIHWIQVLNNEDIKRSDIVKDYGITAFPTKILLDRDGKIIARYVGENNDLDIKLETLFKR